MVKLSDMRKGSVVMVRGAFGQDAPREAVVDEIGDDIKNGEPGISYDAKNEDGRPFWGWAYLDQVDSVVKY